MVESKTRRRWLQFSLRGLLIAITVVAIVLAGKAKRVHDQVAAVRQIQAVGGTVWYQHNQKRFVEFWSAPERMASQTLPGPAWLRNWIGDDYFRYIVQVDLTSTPERQLDNKDLESLAPHLSKLPSLETIYLSSRAIDGAGLAHLQQIASLRNLTVDGVPSSDKDLEQIGQLKTLETLNLRWTEITDEGLVHLRALPNLRCLFLHSRRVTERSIPTFLSLPRLEELIFCDCAVTKADLEAMKQQRPNLRVTLGGSTR